MAARRVVVTGLGLVTPVGVGVQQSWSNLISGKSGIISTLTIENLTDIERAQFESIPSQVVGKVPAGSIADGKWNAKEHKDAIKDFRRTGLFSQYALVAAEEALKDANWLEDLDEKSLLNTGVAVGSSIGSFEDVYKNSVDFNLNGYRKVQPLFVPRLLNNMASGAISINYGFKGPIHSVSTACATGCNAIGDAMRFIKDGYCDVMIAGATEALVHPVAISGFARAKSLVTTYNDQPEKSSRPFDKDRSGFVLGEGAGIVILEELEHAIKRGANKIYGEVIGYGLSGDGYHITAPDPNGDGARRAMLSALRTAGISDSPEKIDYINAHATSTQLGDRAENLAIKSLFGFKKNELFVSSTKSSTGHLLGAAGTVESIFTLLALSEGVLPPTLNLNNVGEADGDNKSDFIFNYVPNQAIKRDIKYALNNSFGFGGVNASLCFKKM
ncbi:fatty acid synthase CEM1 [Ascoidea rubescens DSM 1968]|uniref:3-oxoacyl-[acyl-carrier-protein] synthase n=1 Tax=Ascoidea rubescens DSM 1968 TaxID=1344418 RepID=A0A1D2VCI1_9ASCO|nr:3-oxoacyl-synth [Ascoidea rubescens DSM 1968]ODV59398.1 3-oxoacyl-synth [Ascoidea rubescens DSM 1968]